MEEGLGGGGGHGIITMFTVGSRQVVFMIFAVVLVYILNLLGHFYQDIGLLIRLNHLFLASKQLKSDASFR